MRPVKLLLMSLLMLKPDVVLAADKLFKGSVAVQPNQTLIIGHSTHPRQLECALNCLRLGDQCMAFGYSKVTKDCQLMSCLNMDALTEDPGDIYTDTSLGSSQLLARG